MKLRLPRPAPLDTAAKGIVIPNAVRDLLFTRYVLAQTRKTPCGWKGCEPPRNGAFWRTDTESWHGVKSRSLNA